MALWTCHRDHHREPGPPEDNYCLYTVSREKLLFIQPEILRVHRPIFTSSTLQRDPSIVGLSTIHPRVSVDPLALEVIREAVDQADETLSSSATRISTSLIDISWCRTGWYSSSHLRKASNSSRSNTTLAILQEVRDLDRKVDVTIQSGMKFHDEPCLRWGQWALSPASSRRACEHNSLVMKRAVIDRY
jgi:hypothetical protein